MMVLKVIYMSLEGKKEGWIVLDSRVKVRPDINIIIAFAWTVQAQNLRGLQLNMSKHITPCAISVTIS